MACDTTHFHSGVVPLAFFRMMRDEQRRRQSVSMIKEKRNEGASTTALPVHCANGSVGEETLSSNFVIFRQAPRW